MADIFCVSANIAVRDSADSYFIQHHFRGRGNALSCPRLRCEIGIRLHFVCCATGHVNIRTFVAKFVHSYVLNSSHAEHLTWTYVFSLATTTDDYE